MDNSIGYIILWIKPFWRYIGYLKCFKRIIYFYGAKVSHVYYGRLQTSSKFSLCYCYNWYFYWKLRSYTIMCDILNWNIKGRLKSYWLSKQLSNLIKLSPVFFNIVKPWVVSMLYRLPGMNGPPPQPRIIGWYQSI